MIGYIFRTLRQPLASSNRYRQFTQKMASMSNANGTSPGNKLQSAKSPYLLQHANNPVHWYPWGPEAINKAKEENKLIFLSVGYSTCHWCHVMEKESFEDNEIARVMNQHFISIKVDREERPDIDKVYMTYVQATTGSGGWPMSVWLTPDLKPIYGGTYFPPTDKYVNQPSFKTVLLGIAKQWDEDRSRLERSGSIIVDAILKESSHLVKGEGLPSSAFIHKGYQQLTNAFDPKFGGFRGAPKFPQPVNLKFLFTLYHSKPTSSEGKKSLEMCLHTLKMMAKGGIHDHISQGFHRYSTDEEWHVPHFEKMLYDQAQLAEVYAYAYQITRDPLYKEIAYDILTYVSRDLSDKSGGFYSAEDADSFPSADSKEKKEGAFCVWTKQEIAQRLAIPIEGSDRVKLADVFCDYYNIRENGNVDPRKDPHNELKNENVLFTRDTLEEVANRHKLDVAVVKKSLVLGRDILSKTRSGRPKPHLDNKMIAAWNGLMMTAFAVAGEVFRDEKLISRAINAATFMETNLYDATSQTLRRSCYVHSNGNVVQNDPPINGFSEDYAFVIEGLLHLFDACGDIKWLNMAIKLQEYLDQSFWDPADGGYFHTDGKDTSVLLRLKDDQDGAQPSSNSVSCLNLLKLSILLFNEEMKVRADDIFKLFSLQLKAVPLSLPLLLSGLLLSQSKWKRILVVGAKSTDIETLMTAIHSNFTPNKVVVLIQDSADHPLYKQIALTDQINVSLGSPTVYVCEGKTCSLPITAHDQLAELMKK